MNDYQNRADLLKTWTVDEVKAHPELAVGQLHSAASTIEKLNAELARLNQENFWLSKEQREKDNVARNLPLKRGDMAWGVGKRGQNLYIKPGEVSLVDIEDGKVYYTVYGVCRGEYGSSVFSTPEEAREALKNHPGYVKE